jgi:hypothetical protein
MDDNQHRLWGNHKPLPLGPSARRLTRAEVAACYPGVPISPLYGVPRSAVYPDALPPAHRRRTDKASGAAWPKSGHLYREAQTPRRVGRLFLHSN